MNGRIVDAVIDRLAELAVGARPKYSEFGICENLNFDLLPRVRYGEPEYLLKDVFHHMGFISLSNPLGDVWVEGNRWAGRRGFKRRALCYRVMVELIASAGYRGKYQ